MNDSRQLKNLKRKNKSKELLKPKNSARKEKFYITTTLPYVNSVPHLGHASEFIKADIIARYKRMVLGEKNVWFNSGLDENGLKNYQKAIELGKDTKEFVDEISKSWLKFTDTFGISYNTFYRTSEDYHVKPAQYFWKASLANGDIYKKKYRGNYCVGCEEFKTSKSLLEGNICPVHEKPTIEIEEENYFFRLSKYREPLLNWLKENPEVLKPVSAVDELKNWIEDMEDISISRSKENLKWGVSVPDDDEQVMYVWFDALTNYVNVLGYGDGKLVEGSPVDAKERDFSEWWPGVQIFGVDNLRFQCAIWQAMLLSAGLPNTKKLLRNGFILASDGRKMSKTLGNVINPMDLAEKYSVEAVRFYISIGIPNYINGSANEEDLVSLYNSHLANKFGNLITRIVTVANNNGIKLDSLKAEPDFANKVSNYYEDAIRYYEQYEIQEACLKVGELTDFGNEYLTEKAPWSKENKSKKEYVEQILNNITYLLEKTIELYSPVIPFACKKAKEILVTQEKTSLFPKLEG